MSSLIGGVRPLSVPFSGACDGSGNLTKTLPPLRAAFWTHTKLVATVSAGTPRWLVSNQAGPLGTGSGIHAEIAPILLAPNDTITVTVAGAAPNAVVQGQLVGAQAPTAEEAMAHQPTASAVTVETSNPQIILGTVSATAGNTASATFPVPAGTQSLGFINDLSPAGNQPVSEVSLTGVVTQETLFDTGTGGKYPNGPILMPVDPLDTSITVNVKAAAAGPGTVRIFAQTAPSQIVVGNTNLNPVPVVFSAALPNAQPPVAIAVLDTAALGAGATATLVAAVAGARVYVYSWYVQIDSAPGAAGNDVGALWSTTHAVTYVIANSGKNNAANYADWGPMYLGGGIPTPTGEGLVFTNPDTVAHKTKVVVTWNQGP